MCVMEQELSRAGRTGGVCWHSLRPLLTATPQATLLRHMLKGHSVDNIFKLDLNKKIETNKAATVASSKAKQTVLCILVYFIQDFIAQIVIRLHI